MFKMAQAYMDTHSSSDMGSLYRVVRLDLSSHASGKLFSPKRRRINLFKRFYFSLFVTDTLSGIINQADPNAASVRGYFN